VEVDEPVRRVLLIEITENLGQYDVFEYIPMIASVKAVAITKQNVLRSG
jgi:hypothetical protein